MLDIGENIRYNKIGAGTVIDHVKRDFAGQPRVFAVIDFPHKDMSMQLPIGDPIVIDKISPVYSKTKIRKTLLDLKDFAEPLPRTWDVREQIGERALTANDPEEWFSLLASYAYAEGSGVATVASDRDLVRSVKELVSAELACAAKIEYPEAKEEVEEYYQKTVKKVKKIGKKASSYAGVKPG